MGNSKTHDIPHDVLLTFPLRGSKTEASTESVTVTASTPALAAKMAEKMPRFATRRAVAVRVTTARDIECHCSKCNCVIFEGELTRLREGLPRCFDCA